MTEGGITLDVEPDPRIATMEAEHGEISGTVRRTMLTLLGLELYCVVATFGIADVELVASHSKISLPISGAEMSATGFMIATPLILAVIVIYMHVFYGRLLQLDREIAGDLDLAYAHRAGNLIKAPSLFNFDSAFPRLLTGFIFYWSVPIVLAVITFTLATPFPDYFLPLMVLTILVSVAFLVVSIRRAARTPLSDQDQSDRKSAAASGKGIRFAGWSLAVALIVVMGATPFLAESFTRSLSLERIDLTGQILRDRRLAGANLRDAELANADLSGADLRNADLRGANLDKARLIGANLNGADLTGATLTGADLSRADLSGAKLHGDNLHSAVLSRAVLIGADLRRVDLSRADLSGADLTTAVLSGANLYFTRVKNTTFRGAALDAVKNMQQRFLATATPSAPPTALPDRLTWPFEEKDGRWVLKPLK